MPEEKRRKSVANYDYKEKILVVDSDENFTKFFKIHLGKYFSKVIVTNNSKEALNYFKENLFDVIIVDVGIIQKNCDCFTLVSKIRKLNKNISIIFMTGFDLNESQKSRINAADGLLKKPFSMEDFHECLKQAIEKRTRLSGVGAENSSDAYELFEKKFYPSKKQKVS